MILFVRSLTTTPTEPLRPDIVRVAGFARSFEPLIYYSEHGVRQLGDLQETGTAVWDLGESVRSANLISSPQIVSALEDLGESLQALATELTGFFTSVDGDFDNILLVMDWARRELAALDSMPYSTLGTAVTNLHSMFSSLGLLHSSTAAALFTNIFGITSAERTRATLQRTFLDLLSTLEDSINSELTHTAALFTLYGAIDKQFLNLQRATIREFDNQEKLEGEVLSSLWQRALGAHANRLRKYEKNKSLLQSVRERTVLNKNLLIEHNGKLVALKQNLENLRRRLVGPLLKVGEGSSGGIEDQIKGLQGTYDHLKGVRQRQKERVMESLYGQGSAAKKRKEYETREIKGK